MNREEVFVLGAGASSAHGAPLSNELLPYALCVAAPVANQERQKAWLQQVRDFLSRVFHVSSDVLEAPINDRELLRSRAREYPGLVDVLSVVDMALDRKESLTRDYPEQRLRHVRESLEYTIYLALHEALSDRNPFRKSTNATTKLAARCADPTRCAAISLNYDVLIDIALVGNRDALEQPRAPLDYGLEFANVETAASGSPYLLKLHGSFNWLYSSVSGDIHYGGLQKRIGLLYDEPRQQNTPIPEFEGERLADLRPILVTPTHLKDLRNEHLASLWRQAGQVLREAAALTFIGYSLPGDDLHIKYLIKRALETGTLNPRITVVDHNPDGGWSWVQENYETFFGQSSVEYYGGGFDAYAEERL